MLLAASLTWAYTQAQTTALPEKSDPTVADSASLLQWSVTKKLPKGYEQEALTALSYFPELKETRVIFRYRNSVNSLKTRPAFISMFLPRGHRSYVIIISRKTPEAVNAIRFDHLPPAARIGVLGHELSHVADFMKKTGWQSFKTAMGHFSTHYMDSLEHHTDEICIEHGLGNELEAWSSFIRSTMHVKNWRGASKINEGESPAERYMNPSSIEKKMQKMHTQISTTDSAF